MSGRLAVIGLGPGDARYLTAEAQAALANAEAVYGYGGYLDRVPPRALLAIVGRMSGLAGARWHAIEIPAIAVERLGVGERGLRLRGEIAGIARAEPDDGETSTHARSPARCPHPGTSTIAK